MNLMQLARAGSASPLEGADRGFFLDGNYFGLLALSISEAAYIAEIHRGGLLSLHKGQLEAGKAPGRRLPNARQSDSAKLLFEERRLCVDWLEERALS